ncbi:hypothetical protein Csa_023093 [Cucumis sativus]|nr:hypothetical protein Csa_023093 [Cucumis sativus]
MDAFKLEQPFHHVVILANTHLYWDPEWADVKLAQAKYLLSRLARFKSLVAENFECTPSVLLAGDFNSTPGDKVHIVLYTYVCNILKMGPWAYMTALVKHKRSLRLGL